MAEEGPAGQIEGTEVVEEGMTDPGMKKRKGFYRYTD